MAQNQFFYHLHTLYCFSVMILSVIQLDSLKFRVSSGRCSTNAFSEIRSFSEPLLFHLFRDHAAERAVYIAVLWIFRSAIVIVPLIVLFELFRWRQRRTPSGAT